MFGSKPKEPICPLVRGPCLQAGCRFWTQILGTHPQTGVEIAEWNCAIAFLPWLLVQNSLHQRQTGASTDKVANEIKKFHDGMAAQNRQLHHMLTPPGDNNDQ